MIRVCSVVVALACIAGTAAAQPYRWVDDKGRVQYTDTPPPPSAKDVRKPAVSTGPARSGAAVPYELQVAMRDYPITLYTAPSCKEACAFARNALNARGAPFKEVQVYDEKTNAELKQVSGGNQVPVMLVGSSTMKGFEQSAFDALLDSARYPRAGILPPGKQAAPPAPADYVPPEQAAAPPTAQPVKPEAPPPPAGPYAPGAPAPKPAAKPAAKAQ